MDKNNKSNIPTVLVVFGATGDLIQRKVAPALFHLFENNQLPQFFSLVGFSRRNLSNQIFQNFVQQAVVRHFGEKRRVSNDFLKLLSYQ